MAQTTEPDGDWPLKRLMSEIVGSGPKSAEDMTRTQAMEAFERILDGEPDATTLGAFWLANRWKRNAPEELAAYIDVMAEQSVEFAAPDCDPVDCGANYDGKGRSALLGVGAGIVAAAAGTPVVAHSGDRVPTQKQDAYKHVLDELGIRTDLTPAESAEMVDETGFGFYYQPNFNPGVAGLTERRDTMGVRTFVNTIETLANPAKASVHLGSFYHLPYAKRIIDTFAESERYEVPRVVMFQGMEGYDDIRPGSTTVAVGENGDLSDFEIQTAEYGMDFKSDDLAVDDVATDSARITEEVVSGEREDDTAARGGVFMSEADEGSSERSSEGADHEDQFADAIALNGAFRIYAREDCETLEEGLSMAREVVDDGSAEAVLDELRAF